MVWTGWFISFLLILRFYDILGLPNLLVGSNYFWNIEAGRWRLGTIETVKLLEQAALLTTSFCVDAVWSHAVMTSGKLLQTSCVILDNLGVTLWKVKRSMDVRVGLWIKLSTEEMMLLTCGVGEDSWESRGLQGDPTSPLSWRLVLGVRWKDWC